MGLPLACGKDDSGSTEPVDTDGDGLSDWDEVMIYGTSPLLPDTDGDGWSDYAEVINFGFDPEHAPYHFNPLIADLPDMAVVFLSPPLLTIEIAETTGETWTVETVTTRENGMSLSTSVTSADGWSETISTPIAVTEEEGVSETVSVSTSAGEAEDEGDDEEGGRDDDKEEKRDEERSEQGGDEEGDRDGAPSERELVFGEVDITRQVTQNYARAVTQGYEPSMTVETSIAFTEEQTASYAEALSLAEAYARSHEVTAVSAKLLITAAIENRGHIGFRFVNFLLTATMIDEASEHTPIGNLVIDAPDYSDFQPFALAPGESTAPLNFSRTNLTLETAQAIFRNAGSVRIQLGLFEIDDATGRAFAFTISETQQKTAMIMIDYGDIRPSEWHQVATKADPSRTSITVRRAFEDVMRIPFRASENSGLMVVRDIGPRTMGGGYWLLELDRQDPSGLLTTTTFDARSGPYDFGSIELLARDVFRLKFIRP